MHTTHREIYENEIQLKQSERDAQRMRSSFVLHVFVAYLF